jgi:hypothetical protein
MVHLSGLDDEYCDRMLHEEKPRRRCWAQGEKAFPLHLPCPWEVMALPPRIIHDARADVKRHWCLPGTVDHMENHQCRVPIKETHPRAPLSPAHCPGAFPEKWKRPSSMGKRASAMDHSGAHSLSTLLSTRQRQPCPGPVLPLQWHYPVIENNSPTSSSLSTSVTRATRRSTRSPSSSRAASALNLASSSSCVTGLR